LRTTINIDAALYQQAVDLTGMHEKTALIREALPALIERESARRLARLGGTEPEIDAPPASSQCCGMTEVLAETPVWIDFCVWVIPDWQICWNPSRSQYIQWLRVRWLVLFYAREKYCCRWGKSNQTSLQPIMVQGAIITWIRTLSS